MCKLLTMGLRAAAGLALLATVAAASPPDPRFSTIDRIGVGNNSGTPVGGTPPGFDVSARDVNNSPIVGCHVLINFAATGVRAYGVQSAGTTVNAAARTLERDAVSGSTNFAARTGGFDNSGLVEVSGNGVVLGDVKWRSTDIDGLDGKTGLGDLMYFSARYLGGVAAPECNFDLSASDVPGLADLNIFASEYLGGVSGTYAW